VEPSPDGQWLAWVQYPEGTLWKSRADGTAQQPLTSKPLEVHLPHWSPDGRRIVFVARSPEAPWMALYVAAADGSATEVIVRPERKTDQYWNPCWMPDSTILFSRLLGRNPAGILQVDPRSRRVTAVPGAEALRWPSSSRLGDVLAYGGEIESLRYFVRLHGTDRWEDVGPAKLGYPHWTRDGTRVCGTGDPEPVACLDIKTRQFTPFEVQPPFPLVTWIATAWAGLDAEDRPLVTADRSTIGFYALDWDAP
jgi:WD40-like Beta Propeller Repeat